MRVQLPGDRPRSPERARSVRTSGRSYCRRQRVVVRSCSEALDMLEVILALVTLTAMEIVLGIDNIIFSLDSVITAVGMVNDDVTLANGFVVGKLWIMSAAVVVAVGVMLSFAGAVGDFVSRHPTLKILALSFLILIGVLLVAEGFGQ